MMTSTAIFAIDRVRLTVPTPASLEGTGVPALGSAAGTPIDLAPDSTV